MNAGERLDGQQVQEQASHLEADNLRTSGQPEGTGKSDVVASSLDKALDALFKAQDHLNTAADQSDEVLAKTIEGINEGLRGLQRQVSQAVYRLRDGQ